MKGNGRGYVGECAGYADYVAASMSSIYNTADNCINGIDCLTNFELAPWLALDYGIEVVLGSVTLINRNDSYAARTKNVHVRVSSTLPVSGSEMFTGGQLLGTFEGPGTPGQRIRVGGGTQLTGRYVVVQMDHTLGASDLKLRKVRTWAQGRLLDLPRVCT